MAEYGEWVRRCGPQRGDNPERIWGDPDFIVKGIQAGKLELREGAVWGNPSLRILRSQLELYIVQQFGSE
jgi:hypothetical protein